MSNRSWWRKQWPWLLGTAILAAAAVAWPYFQWKRVERTFGQEDVAEFVKSGEMAKYRLSNWKLNNIVKLDKPGQLPADVKIRPDAQIIMTTLYIVPGKNKTGEVNTKLCALTLRDGKGRGWNDAPNVLRPYIRQMKYNWGCDRSRDAPRTGGYEIQNLFLIPKDVSLTDLRLEVVSTGQEEGPGDPPGNYLTMQVPGGR